MKKQEAIENLKKLLDLSKWFWYNKSKNHKKNINKIINKIENGEYDRYFEDGDNINEE